MYMFCFDREIESPAYHLLRPRPFADEHQIDPEVVISDHRIKNMLGLFKKPDRFFKTFDAVLRPAQKPVCARHIGIDLSEHERCRSVADDLNSQFEILKRFFAVAFLMSDERN